jgi:hypothetical protein
MDFLDKMWNPCNRNLVQGQRLFDAGKIKLYVDIFYAFTILSGFAMPTGGPGLA